MNTRRDPRANNARRHGLTASAGREPRALELVFTLAGAVPARARSAERLVDSFYDGRRIAQAKVVLLERAAEAAESANGRLFAYTNILAELRRFERYERRAESRFLSASRAFAKAEDATKANSSVAS